MAYGVKYIMQFTSDRGNEIRIEVLKKDYQGEVMYKSLGGSPSLSIEQGDGAIKGSSLVFAMQADIEGELQELYTTDNKQFKVNMYRNEVLTWQGYILPELYSEEYVDAPYDVSVTATDQLATLKAITYQREDVNVSLSTIIEDILSFTQISVPVTYHQNLSALRKGEVPMLVDSHISQAAYNGYSCYDVLNNILLSCNCCIMQINGEWLITSLTNSTTNYYTAGVTQVREHKALGQLGVGEVCPAGTLTMVNNPALKGARVEYAHMLRHSFLVNADCVDREGWNYTPDSRNPIDIPGEREAFGKIFKAYCWELHPVNIRENNSLQLWQEVSLEKDERNYYELSVKTLFGTDAKLLLMAVTYLGSDGVERRLTSEGWIETWDKSDVNYYIQITGTNKNAGLDGIADIEQYEMSTVQFALPPVDGTMRIGFINSTTDYADPLASAPIYVSQVYLTVSGVTGQECTTEVEPNATQEQQGVLLAYGDTFESENAYKLGLNTLKKSSGENITSWWLDNVNFSSYYETMLQEFSRYFGVKKAQLQGIIMGKDVLSNIYTDVFSGRVMRLLTAQVDLLADEAIVTVEEIVTTSVDFDTVIYATNNTNSFGSSSGGGGGTSGGSSSTAGESLLGVQSDGDVYVKDGRALVGQEGRFENLALPVDAPTERKETKTYLYSSDPSKGAIDIAKIAKWIDEQEQLWYIDEDGNVRTTHNIVVEGGGAFGMGAESGGSTGGLGSVTIKTEGGIEYKSDASGVVTVPNWITASAIPSALKNPYALSWSGYSSGSYDGSGTANIVIPTSLPASDVYDWAKAATKPSYTASEVGALSASGGTLRAGIRDLLTLEDTNTGSDSRGAFITMRSGYSANNYSAVGRNTSIGTFLENYQDGVLYALYITNDGLLKFRDNQVVDASNISSYALPLSGGTITGNLFANGYIGMGDCMITKSHYLFVRDNANADWIVTNRNWSAEYTLIHSGNIGSYNAGSADYLKKSYGEENVNYAKGSGVKMIFTTASDKNAPIYTSGLSVITDYCGWQMVTYAVSASTPNPYFRAMDSDGSYTMDWKQLAFLTDNVASATKLQTARYIFGQPFNGTYNIETTTYGMMRWLYFSNSSGAEQGYVGRGSDTNDIFLSVYGENSLHFSTNNTIRATIVPNGNVLVGTTSDNGSKLQVNGSISAMGEMTSSSRYVVTAAYDATNPTEQAIVINSAAGASTYAGWPGIGFHIPGITYATIKYGSDNTFHFMNFELGTWVDIKVGNLVAIGGGAFGSDVRYKDIISFQQLDLETIVNAPLFTFRWNDREDNETHLGTSAQYWLNTQFKDAVNTSNKDFFHLDYGALAVGIGISVAREVKGVKTEVEQLRNKVKDLETKLSKYEQVWHN